MSDDQGEIALKLIIDAASQYNREDEITVIKCAYMISKRVFQINRSLDNIFFEQAVEVALQIAERGSQSQYIAGCLLSFPYCQGEITDESLQGKVDKNILSILNTLYKLGIQFDNYLPWIYRNLERSDKKNDNQRDKKDYWERRTSQNKPYAFMQISQDTKISIIKVLERLFLLNRIKDFPITQELIPNIARDGLDLYAPIAESIGMWKIKSQIEDIAFKILWTDEHLKLLQELETEEIDRLTRVNKAKEILSEKLKIAGINAQITGRAKHLYSLYLKIKQTGKSVHEINDILGLRVIINSWSDCESSTDEKIAIEKCYQTLGILFNLWPPVMGVYEEGKKFRDWISTPKPNGYKSIHTTVEFEGNLLEVQIRTEAMHDLAENGEASHWVYKKTGKSLSLSKRDKIINNGISKLRHTHEEDDQA